MSGVVTAVAVIGAVGGAYLNYENGQAAQEANRQALDQQQRQADAALAAQNEAQRLQLEQANKALTAQQEAYAAQMSQAEKALLAQQQQADAMLGQATSQAAAQQAAMAAQLAASQQQFEQQTQQINRANQKAPDTANIISENIRGAKGGQSGTLLTGPAGVQTDKLLLGRSTLLGQ